MFTKFCVLCFFSVFCIQISYQKQDRCFKTPEEGSCLARVPRLYYHAATNSCKEFFYGGCGGNDNNFETLEECHNVCVTETEATVSDTRCSLGPEVGNCKAFIQRMYYDSDTNTCKAFTYGGCGGNENNFNTTANCQSACVRDTTAEADRCYLKSDPGICKARLPRLFYDIESNTCNEFIYGGCQGNANNFQSLEECDTACVSLTRYGESYCYLAMDEGSCKQSLPRLHFDPRSNTCKQFTYGGCDGNANNFDTIGECQNACIRSTPANICTLKAEKGNCRGIITRFYYDSTTRACGQFIYGGCGGNENNFDTLDECELRCDNLATIAASTYFNFLIVGASMVVGRIWL